MCKHHKCKSCTGHISHRLISVSAAKVKVKLSLGLTKYHATKTNKWVEVWVHAFLMSGLHEGDWLASRPDHFTSGEKAPGTHRIGGWAGPKTGLDAAMKRKIPVPCREPNPYRPARGLFTVLTELPRHLRYCINLQRLDFFSSPPRPDQLWDPPSIPSNGYRVKPAGSWSWPLASI
jgi:hypothetical protein